ncbi:MAG: hypothetical protein VZQ80_05170 [Lachnospiraceae bacterium]|nr:hypothetical protein [Lachnospiraceae bacterium]
MHLSVNAAHVVAEQGIFSKCRPQARLAAPHWREASRRTADFQQMPPTIRTCSTSLAGSKSQGQKFGTDTAHSQGFLFNISFSDGRYLLKSAA